MIRYRRETQRQVVERVLRDEGRIATFDALYHLEWEDGRRCSISRLAAVVFDLRRDGWQIDTKGDKAETAVYVLRSQPIALQAPPPPPVRESWQAGWRCTNCGSLPLSRPEPLLGDLGRGYCGECRAQRHFRRAA